MHSDPFRPFTTPDRKISEPVIHVRRGKELPVLPAEALGQQWSREGSDNVLRFASSPPFTRDTGMCATYSIFYQTFNRHEKVLIALTYVQSVL